MNLRCFGALTISLFGLGALAGCDSDVGKALAKAADANNNQPGEADGRAVTIATSPAHNSAVATDGTNVVLVQDNGDVFQFPAAASAGTLTKLGTFGTNDGQRSVAHVELDANYIWFMSELTTIGLFRMPRAGGASEKVADLGSNEVDFALTADAIYFIGTSSIIRKFDIATKATTDFATGFQNLNGLAFDADAKKLWVSDVNGNAVSSIDITQPAPVTPVAAIPEQPSPGAITVGNGYVYWSNGQLGPNEQWQQKIMRFKLDGTGQPEIVASDEAEFPHPLRVDANFLYAGGGSGIKRVPIAGGNLTQYLRISLADFLLNNNVLFAVENNGFKLDEDAKKAPNRILAVTE